VSLALFFGAVLGVQGQTFQIEIVADNDWALFAGNSTSATTQVYQNGVVWNSQLTTASSQNYTLTGAETTFYLVALDAGGDANISGRINGTNIWSIWNTENAKVQVSGNIASFLPNYGTSGSAIANGTYTVAMSDLNSALSSATFSNPTYYIEGETNPSQTVINSNSAAVIGNGTTNYGFTFPVGTAVVFKFSISEVPANPVPEPSTYAAILGACALGLVVYRRRKAALRA